MPPKCRAENCPIDKNDCWKYNMEPAPYRQVYEKPSINKEGKCLSFVRNRNVDIENS